MKMQNIVERSNSCRWKKGFLTRRFGSTAGSLFRPEIDNRRSMFLKTFTGKRCENSKQSGVWGRLKGWSSRVWQNNRGVDEALIVLCRITNVWAGNKWESEAKFKLDVSQVCKFPKPVAWTGEQAALKRHTGGKLKLIGNVGEALRGEHWAGDFFEIVRQGSNKSEKNEMVTGRV